MNEMKNGKQPLSPHQALRLNEVCVRFEEAWKGVAGGGEPPSVADFLGEESDPDHLAILREIVLLDIEYRHRRGEILALKDYAERFPELDQVVESTVRYVP